MCPQLVHQLPELLLTSVLEFFKKFNMDIMVKIVSLQFIQKECTDILRNIITCQGFQGNLPRISQLYEVKLSCLVAINVAY